MGIVRRRVGTCKHCLEVRQNLSSGAVADCRQSLEGCDRFLRGGRVRTFKSIAGPSMLLCLRFLGRRGLTATSVKEVVADLQGFRRCLGRRKLVRGSPVIAVRLPGGRRGLPGILSVSRVRHLVTTPSIGAILNLESHTVLRLLCTANLHIDRLVRVAVDRVRLSVKFVRAVKGNSGREVIPLKRRTTF